MTRLCPAPACQRREPEHVDRAAPSPSSRRPVADRLGGDLARAAAPPPAARAPSARSAASADEWVQPEPCEAPSGCRGPVDPHRHGSPSKKTSAPSSAWPPVTTTASGPSARTARASSSGVAASPSPVELAGLGQVRGRHRGARAGSARSAPLRAPGRAGPRRSRRPSPGRPRPAPSPTRPSASTTASIVGCVDEHPDLDRVDADVLGHRAHLVDDHLARHRRAPSSTPTRVLGGERDDRRGPVNAAAGERLQVRLDPGAAAGIRAGDRDRARGMRESEPSPAEALVGS